MTIDNSLKIGRHNSRNVVSNTPQTTDNVQHNISICPRIHIRNLRGEEPEHTNIQLKRGLGAARVQNR